ncbi:MAG: major capsid protein [Synergistaceae bacterium]|nr:major capsid protein [Synergistaceae bacterium]
MTDYYDPRFLAGVITKTPATRTFFRDRFFRNVITFPTETVSFEVQESKRTLAPYVSQRLIGAPISREGYTVKTFRTPLLAPYREITNDTIAQKLLGENPCNSGVSPEERAQKIAARDIIFLQDTITRREEFMCARTKQDGVLLIQGEGVDASVDYGFSNIVLVDATDRWTASYDILTQLSKYADKLNEAGTNPDLIILGRDAAAALLKNTEIRALLDNRRIEIGEIKPSELENGVSYIGRISIPGASFDLISYNEWYRDNDGTAKPIVDPETVIIQSSREQNSMLYGAVTFVDKSGEFVTSMAQYTPRQWFTENPPQKFIQIMARPLPMPHDLESWFVLKGVVTGAI